MDAACEEACACEIIFCDVELPDWTNNLPAACQYRTQALRIWKKVVPPFLSNRLCYTWCTMPRSLASIFRKSYKRNKFLPFSNFLLTYHYFLLLKLHIIGSRPCKLSYAQANPSKIPIPPKSTNGPSSPFPPPNSSASPNALPTTPS
jgi:hypothetical protein